MLRKTNVNGMTWGKLMQRFSETPKNKPSKELGKEPLGDHLFKGRSHGIVHVGVGFEALVVGLVVPWRRGMGLGLRLRVIVRVALRGFR